MSDTQWSKEHLEEAKKLNMKPLKINRLIQPAVPKRVAFEIGKSMATLINEDHKRLVEENKMMYKSIPHVTTCQLKAEKGDNEHVKGQ